MNIAIIPARKNSIRIKNKNRKLFFQKPIIEYSILAAKRASIFKFILVSTDCNKIANISKKAGAIVFKRPKKLSLNNVGIIEVVKDVILRLNRDNIFPKHVCCIFPAAPLIESKKIVEGLKKIKRNKYDFIFSASKLNFDFFKSFCLTNHKYIKLLFKKNLSSKKSVKYAYIDVGQFYWAKVKTWLKRKNTFTTKSSIIEIERIKAQDINYLEDWEFAKLLYKAKK